MREALSFNLSFHRKSWNFRRRFRQVSMELVQVHDWRQKGAPETSRLSRLPHSTEDFWVGARGHDNNSKLSQRLEIPQRYSTDPQRLLLLLGSMLILKFNLHRISRSCQHPHQVGLREKPLGWKRQSGLSLGRLQSPDTVHATEAALEDTHEWKDDWVC